MDTYKSIVYTANGTKPIYPSIQLYMYVYMKV